MILRYNSRLASSQTCNSCGNRKRMPVDIRIYKECGYIDDRDINAAKNISKWGFQEFFGSKKGRKSPVDVVFGMLLMDDESSTQKKHEAVCFS